jgi:hypothetical protein
MRIDAETTLYDVPAGQANANDATVRIFNGDGMCSGALVGASVVVTAQHCATEVPEEGGPDLRAIPPGNFRVELGGKYLPWGRAGVTGVVTCPCWQHQAGRDVAVLVLERPVPADVPRFAPRLHGGPFEGERVRAAGYGTGSEQHALVGSDGFILQSHRTQGDGVAALVLGDSFYLDVHAERGDSGGPVWSLDNGELLGVLSLGTEHDEDNKAGELPTTVAARLDGCAGTIEYAERLARSGVGAPDHKAGAGADLPPVVPPVCAE